MNTSGYTTRRSVEEMRNIVAEREARENAERQAQELAERDAAIAREEQLRTSRENQIATDQGAINQLCQHVDDQYTGMVDTAKSFIRNERKESEIHEELELFVDTVAEIYEYNEVDASVASKMKIRKFAYHLLPWLDAVFAFFALLPIMTSELFGVVPQGNAVIVVTGALLSVFMGILLAHIARMAAAGMSDKNSLGQRFLVGATVMILPMMYILGGLVFADGYGWMYNVIFALVSFLIQCVIVMQFDSHTAALEYFKSIKEAERVKTQKESNEQAIRNELASCGAEKERLLNKFNQQYNEFCSSFRDLTIRWLEFTQKYDKQAYIPLNQIVIMFGNLQVFQAERLPIRRTSAGIIETLSVSSLPDSYDCFAGLQVANANNIGLIDMMIRNANIGLPLLTPQQRKSITALQEPQLTGGGESTPAPKNAEDDSAADITDNDDIDMPQAWL